jgi:hypothetical protein
VTPAQDRAVRVATAIIRIIVDHGRHIGLDGCDLTIIKRVMADASKAIETELRDELADARREARVDLPDTHT